MRGCRPASRDCQNAGAGRGRFRPATPTTTDDAPIAAASSTRPGPTTALSPTSPRSGSSADSSSAAS